MKNEQPLTDRDFANVRKSVMTAIEARQARRVWTIRAMQLAFALLVVTVGTWWLVRPSPAPMTTSPGPQAPQMARTQDNTAAPQEPQVKQTASPSLAAAIDHPKRMTRTAARRRHHTPVHEIETASLTEPLRLELTTDDPDIRIIWITNPTNSR